MHSYISVALIMINIDQFHEIEMRIGKILSAEKVPDTDKLLKLSVDMGLKPSAGEILPDHSGSQNGLEVKPASEPNAPGDEEPKAQEIVSPERDIRQIVSGISAYFPDPSVLMGKHVAFVVNLAPRMLRGLESQGMILAVHEGDAFALMEVPDTIPPGTRVG